MYKVVKEFHDLQDYKTSKSGLLYQHYDVGDLYPRKGFSPSNLRIEELLSADNAQGSPLIVEIDANGEEIAAETSE